MVAEVRSPPPPCAPPPLPPPPYKGAAPPPASPAPLPSPPPLLYSTATRALPPEFRPRLDPLRRRPSLPSEPSGEILVASSSIWWSSPGF
jgi:hypothetical protein